MIYGKVRFTVFDAEHGSLAMIYVGFQRRCLTGKLGDEPGRLWHRCRTAFILLLGLLSAARRMTGSSCRMTCA
jgi:hypothetical protein